MSEKIAILTDSTCGLTPDHLKKLGIYMVPLSVFFGEEEFQDTVELSEDQFYQKLSIAIDLPSTSQPPPDRFVQMFEKLKQEGYTDVICIHLSKKLSGTIQSAQQAAKMMNGINIHIIDSKSVCVGLGYLVEYAQSLVAQKQSCQQVLDAVNSHLPNIKILFSVGSLEALQRGGRIGKAQALLGKYLGIKPVLKMQDAQGEIEVLEKVFSADAARKVILRECLRHIEKPGIKQGLTIIHAGVKSYQDKMLELLKAELPQTITIRTARIGAVVGTHLGADGWGVILS